MRPPRHLHLVGREPKKPARKKYQRAPLLTPDEERRFRAALTNLQGAFGSWECLAHAMGVRVHTINHARAGRVSVSGDLIVRAIRASGLTYADLVGAPRLVRRAS